MARERKLSCQSRGWLAFAVEVRLVQICLLTGVLAKVADLKIVSALEFFSAVFPVFFVAVNMVLLYCQVKLVEEGGIGGVFG